MKTISELEFSEACCGNHVFACEYVRPDGVGFEIRRKPDEAVYSMVIYEPDMRTVRSRNADLTEAQANALLAS